MIAPGALAIYAGAALAEIAGCFAAVGTKTAYIEPGSPWENGYIESFNARIRDNFSMARSSTRSLKPGLS